jgi:hypothetical protein
MCIHGMKGCGSLSFEFYLSAMRLPVSMLTEEKNLPGKATGIRISYKLLNS